MRLPNEGLRSLAGLALMLTAACSVADNPTGPAPTNTAITNQSAGPQNVRDQYIITLNANANDISDVARELARSASGQVIRTYAQALSGIVDGIHNQGRGLSAFIIESLLSCGGQLVLPPG